MNWSSRLEVKFEKGRYPVIDMGKKKNTIDSRRWCNGFTCRFFDCKWHPGSIPQKYRNSVFRYVDPNNFDHCERWEAVAARQEQEKRKEQKNEDNVI